MDLTHVPGSRASHSLGEECPCPLSEASEPCGRSRVRESEREREREREEMGRAGVVVQEFWLSLVWSEKASGSVTSHAGGQPADPN